MTWHSVHRALLRDRGPAKALSCVECGQQALDWAFRESAVPLTDERTGRVYSEDLADYDPMCRMCHLRRDKVWLEGGAARRVADPAFDEKRRAVAVKAASMQSREGKQAGARAVNQLRRRCECGRVMPPSGLGSHQRASGHSTWTEVAA